MKIVEIKKLPFVEFGETPKRQVRIPVAPQVDPETNCVFTAVSTTLPPLGVSEGHIHEDCDEMILFMGKGEVKIDNRVFPVEPMTLVTAHKGEQHECRNISETADLELFCIFSPPLTPYGKYPELIEETRRYLYGGSYGI